MAYRSVVSGDVVLTFLGENIPTIGPRFKSREEAVRVARRYVGFFNKIAGGPRETAVKVSLKKQADGRYSLVVEGGRRTLGRLDNLDELLLKRFRKGLKKKLFILTCFVEGVDGLECLVLTEGLGAVFYAPYAVRNWRPWV